MENESGLVAMRLSDGELISRLRGCVAQERKVSARLLEHLGEVDARGLYRDQGFSSMFDYAVHGLNMSEPEAGLRLYVARWCRLFPEALEMLGRGELHLTALRLLAPKLTRENMGLLTEARFKTKQQVLALLATRFPQVDVPDLIRGLPKPAVVEAVASSESMPVVDRCLPDGDETVRGSAAMHAGGHAVASFCLQPPAAAGSIEPLSAHRYKVQFTASRQLHDKIEQARDLLRHQCPSGDLAVVFERALDLLIAERRKQHFGESRRPRVRRARSAHKSNTRYIPRAVRREVVARDGGRCSFVGRDGQRCAARGGLEFDHVVPFARGGRATTENLRLRCRSHNALWAERVFGRAFLQRVRFREAPWPAGLERSKHASVSMFRNMQVSREEDAAVRCEDGAVDVGCLDQEQYGLGDVFGSSQAFE